MIVEHPGISQTDGETPAPGSLGGGHEMLPRRSMQKLCVNFCTSSGSAVALIFVPDGFPRGIHSSTDASFPRLQTSSLASTERAHGST